MEKNTVHLHQNNHFRKTNIFLLLVPALIYVFIVVFYLITSGGIKPELSSSLFGNTGLGNYEETVLGETNIDK